jgi:hypothetical protein
VQAKGQQAEAELKQQLQQQAAGEAVPEEALDESLAALPLAIGADGVMVPFRPTPQSTCGKTKWQEIKVGVLARLEMRQHAEGQCRPQLQHRRVVAVVGKIDAFIPPLRLEARRQAFESAPQVIWRSDGGRGFWRVYQTCFAHCAIAVLDFFHAAGHLWRATTALVEDPRSAQAMNWFRRWRHPLRHGQHHQVLTVLTALINTDLYHRQILIDVVTSASLLPTTSSPHPLSTV